MIATVLLVVITILLSAVIMVAVMNQGGGINTPMGAVRSTQALSASQFQVEFVSIPGGHFFSEFRLSINGFLTTYPLDRYINPDSFSGGPFSLFVVDLNNDSIISGGDYATVLLQTSVAAGDLWHSALVFIPSGGVSAFCDISLRAFAHDTPEGHLRAAWGFTEGAGNKLHDTTNNSLLTISILGDTRWMTNGAGVYALEFLNSAAPYGYAIGPDCALLRPTSQITLEAWVYPKVVGSVKIVQKGDWDGYGLGMDKYKGFMAGVSTAEGKGITVFANAVPALNQWYHLTMTYDGSNLVLYVNGAAVGERQVNGTMSYNLARTFSIASDNGAQKWFTGLVSDVRVYGSALTAAQVASLYAATKPSYGGAFTPS